jgi:hypothetical protein
LLRVTIVLAIALIVAFDASDASALSGEHTAHFLATLSGSYTSSAAVTESECVTAGPNGESTPIAPVTTNVSDNATFSARATPVSVEFLDAPPLLAASDHRLLAITVSDTRASGLTGGGAVPGCRGASASDPPAVCATRTHTFEGNVTAGIHGVRLGFLFVRERTFVAFPEDIFDRCILAPGQTWFGKLPILTAPVSATDLFNRHKRVITVSGSASGAISSNGGGQASSGHFSEHFVLTLTRRG